MSDTKSSKPADIRFQMFAVVNKTNGTKARVHYSLDNTVEFYEKGIKSITIYDRDYGRDLQKVFADTDVAYQNDTDSMTDYFDKGRVRISETSSLYPAARKAIEEILAKLKQKSDARQAARIERFRAKRIALGQVAA